MQKALLKDLDNQLEGALYYDSAMRTLYATDASAYRVLPLAVAIPETVEDLRKLIRFATEHDTSLIPRTAGTSLAGQVVGDGIIVDVSEKFNQILHIDKDGSAVTVQPGVVRDVLNHHLAPHGLFFAPETSTANRAMVGGMVGNNSCGLHSPLYGTTREHVVSVKALLSDGTEVEFKELSPEEFHNKRQGIGVSSPLEAKLYQDLYDMLANPDNQESIRKEYPKPEIKRRRNTGYAIDQLLESEIFTPGGAPFNFCKLIAGSEGTLAFLTEITLNCVPVPPKEVALLCAHFNTIHESLLANVIAMKHGAGASELMDKYIIERTQANIEYRKNTFFIEGQPEAVLMIEFARHDAEELEKVVQGLVNDLKAHGYGYHYPVFYGEETNIAWGVRKAGLGLLSNKVGDAKAAPVIEDTAVAVEDLPDYIAEFNQVLDRYGLSCVHYAHAGDGELHLRPVLNLKAEDGRGMFRTIASEIATLVKKYRGSLSGEHGDGRLRAEFINFMIGDRNYRLLKELKNTWDPNHIFNPGKIVDAPPMDTHLRFEENQETPEFDTFLDFSANQGILRAAEQCNGSGDCRKTHITGGTMCPSYMATRREKDTTRARANILREYLTRSDQPNRFNHEEIKEVMDLCLSCKGCKSECPSNVDVGKMKAEFLQQYYEENGIPFRSRLIANFTNANKLASLVPWAYNFVVNTKPFATWIKKLSGFHPERSLPNLGNQTLYNWYSKHQRQSFVAAKGVTLSSNDSKAIQLSKRPEVKPPRGKVYVFCDEFSNYNDVEIGIKTIRVLEQLGYEVEVPGLKESGRTYLSKGLLKQARSIARENVRRLKDKVSEETPIIGIEPSAILSLRDEYIDLLRGEEQEAARKVAEHTLLFEEFIAREMDTGNITSDQFTNKEQIIKLHGHCHQKALSGLVPTKKALSLPTNYQVHLIRSGCCGMAGSFGYEKEHYELSMNIGELVLFPKVREQKDEVIIAAPGTSCRHQIKDGTGKIARHPAEILFDALKT